MKVRPGPDTTGPLHDPAARIAAITSTARPLGPLSEGLLRVDRSIHRSPGSVAQRRLVEAIAGSPAQRVESLPEEEPLQLSRTPDEKVPVEEDARQGALPPGLRLGIEALSGVDASDVRVHANSELPGRIQARAFARGSEIHLARGQERHLPHEAWHIVQQRQGRVRPTLEVGGVGVNDEPALEQEATVMGRRAVNHGGAEGATSQRAVRAVHREETALQPFWELTADGKVVWKDGAAPQGHLDTGQKKRGGPVFQAPAARDEAEDRRAAEAAAARNERAQRAAARAHPATRRRDFTREESTRLKSLPLIAAREDDTPNEATGWGGRRKAHLTPTGLHTAGEAAITATEQQDQESTRKGRGNRISSKAPAGGGADRSQSYGGQLIGIKARKLERARLRGKSDAQNVTVRSTDDILGELDAGPDASNTGKARETLKAFARKDRELHHVVDFHSPDDPEHYIPNRFLIQPDGTEEHDSDSESESDDEAEVLAPVLTASASGAAVAPATGKRKKKRRNRNTGGAKTGGPRAKGPP